MGQHRPYWNAVFIEIQQYFQHLWVSVKVKFENYIYWIVFSNNFPRWPVGVKSCHVVLKFHDCTQFPFNVKKTNTFSKQKSFLCVAKTPHGKANIAMRWFPAGLLCILIFESRQVCDWRRLIMLGIMDLMWPRVSRRFNFGPVTVCNLRNIL